MEGPVLFHLAGVRLGDGLAPLDPSLRPALFARFGDLTRLRYDFPLVLIADGADGPCVRPLSAIVDELLAGTADKGIAGDRMRRSVLRVERGIRGLLAAGQGGVLSALWTRAAEAVIALRGSEAAGDLARARAALAVDGEVVDCDEATPLRVVRHVWRSHQARRADALRRRIDRASGRLADLIVADLQRSDSGRRPERLRASVGTPHRDLFDFDLMAHLLAKPSGPPALPAWRRHRIEETLVALRRGRSLIDAPEALVFDAIDAALAAFRERRHAMAEAARALAVAELEVEGRYVEATHDVQIRRADEDWLTPEVLALFPDVLVRIGARAAGAAVRAQLLEGLTSDAPLKVLFETDDAIGVDGQLATTAMGLGDVFVVQTPSAHLPRMTGRVTAAVAHGGPSLISVFTGVTDRGVSPAYLVSAAAMTARAFPAFSYDPAAGSDWRHRFALHADPQPERTWPTYTLSYAGAARRRMTSDVAFTVADLALCDPRRASHFAAVVGDAWADQLAPLAETLDADARTTARAPFVHAVDEGGRLRRVVVDQGLVAATRRAADAWRRLRELDGLKQDRAMTPPPAQAAATNGHAAPAEATAAGPTETPVAPATAEGRDPDEPYIETARCSTCNECTLLNPRMFAYDENKQAYIKDIKAGTYRELVEAAESCQVAIIHPGKPRDPSEPGLDELLQRAEAFR